MMTPIELDNGSDSFCVDLDAVSCLFYQDGEIVLEFAGSPRFLRIEYDESAYQAVKGLYLGKISMAEYNGFHRA